MVRRIGKVDSSIDRARGAEQKMPYVGFTISQNFDHFLTFELFWGF